MKSRVNQLELKVLYDVSKIIDQALSLDHALETILRILSESLAMSRGTITLMNGEKGHLVIRASHGLTDEEKKRGVYRMNEGVTGRIFQTGGPFLVPDIRQEPLFLDKTGSRKIEKRRISFIGIPIILHGKTIGVLSVDRLFDEEISFEEDVRFLTILSTLVGQLVSLNNQVRAREDNLIRSNRSLKAEIAGKCEHFLAMAKSPAMLEVRELIRKVAPTRATVLLLGESGTGKTLVGQIIHELSDRSGNPFIKVNCAALPDNLLESELFGYEKGAFTGATESKSGRVEEAAGGTIFLDEIGELSTPLQAKLLRFLQDREFERLGSTKTREVDVRIITATNRDLEEAVRDGLFREDLYYRLNVFPIRVPPVRERREDIEPLVRFFTKKVSAEYGCELHFHPDAMNALLAHDWPGNVREMENLIERLAIIHDGGIIGVRDLSPNMAHGGREQDHAAIETLPSLREIEQRNILAALERNRWIQSRAAKELGITLRQMGYRVKKFGIEELVERKKGHR